MSKILEAEEWHAKHPEGRRLFALAFRETRERLERLEYLMSRYVVRSSDDPVALAWEETVKDTKPSGLVERVARAVIWCPVDARDGDGYVLPDAEQRDDARLAIRAVAEWLTENGWSKAAQEIRAELERS